MPRRDVPIVVVDIDSTTFEDSTVRNAPVSLCEGHSIEGMVACRLILDCCNPIYDAQTFVQKTAL